MNINDVLQLGFGSVPRLAPLRGVSTRAEPPASVEPASPGPGGTSLVDRAEISSAAKLAAGRELTPEQQSEMNELSKRDREVRTHEQAHKAAGGRYTGAISYEYTTGPDGRRYASGGSVAIDTSPVSGDPDATIRKMQQIQKAALAPADPSAADRNIAATAQSTATEARQEQLKTEQVERTADTDAPKGVAPASSSLSSSVERAPTASDPVYSATGRPPAQVAVTGRLIDRRA